MLRNKNITLKELSQFMKKPPENLKVKVYYETDERGSIAVNSKTKNNTLGQRVDCLETRVNKLDTRMDKLDTRMDKLETRMDKLETRMNKLDTRMDKLETRMARIESKLDRIGDALFEFIKTTNARFDRIETRLDYIVKANHLKDIKQ